MEGNVTLDKVEEDPRVSSSRMMLAE